MCFKRFLILRLFSISLLSIFSAVVYAAPIQIASTPTESSGPFQHNVFHAASSNGGESGAILGWFDLASGGGSWDSVSGAFIINVDIFSDSVLATSIGSATGIGNLDVSAFNGHDGGLIGSIDWAFNMTTSGTGLSNVTTSFYDIDYATSTAGYNANSTTGSYTSMTLWGADGTANSVTGVFDTNTTSMGVDLVVNFVPVPAAVWLFGSGLLGLLAVSRRRFST